MSQIKNLDKAVKRTKKAVSQEEPVVLFGDADLDGVTSVLIVEEALKTLGVRVKKVYFPDREQEGYSLNKIALEKLKPFAPGLLILLDCGVSNHLELKEAESFGFDIIVLDHHEVAEEVPQTGLIVNVKQPKDKYAFKNLSACALTYIFAKELLGKNLSPKTDESFKELACLGVIADMMELQDVNQEVVESGLRTIFSSFRVGFQALKKVIPLKTDQTREFFSQMVSVLNITPLEGNLTLSYQLLKENNSEEALILSKELWLEAEKRRKDIQDFAQDVVLHNEDEKKIIFEGFTKIPQALTGAVASRVLNRTQKPVFIYKLNHEKCRGSVRAPKGIDSVEALKTCSHLLLMYGGHKPASGFSLKNENLEAFKQCLEKYFNND